LPRARVANARVRTQTRVPREVRPRASSSCGAAFSLTARTCKKSVRTEFRCAQNQENVRWLLTSSSNRRSVDHESHLEVALRVHNRIRSNARERLRLRRGLNLSACHQRIVSKFANHIVY